MCRQGKGKNVKGEASSAEEAEGRRVLALECVIGALRFGVFVVV